MLSGIATLTLKEWDKDGILQTVSQHTQSNLILINAYNLLYRFLPVFTDTASTRICVSSETATANLNRTQFTNSVFATGDSSLIDSNLRYVLYNGELLNPNNPSSVTYTQRFIAPSANRTINSIGISNTASLITNSTGTTVTGLLSYLKLDTPVLQTSSQVLDITYKIFIDWNNSIFNNIPTDLIRMQENVFIKNSNTYNEARFLHSNKYSSGHILNNGFYYLNFNNGGNLSAHVFSDFRGLPNSSAVNISNNIGTLSIVPSYKITEIHETNTGLSSSPNFDGRFLSSYVFGGTEIVPNTPMGKGHLFKIDFSKTSNLSDTTSHSVNSTLVTYDNAELANSSWKPNIIDSPTPDFPATYILRVTQAGGIGVGRYKIYKTGWGGWLKGKWADPIADSFLHFDLSRKVNDPLAPPDDYDYYNYRWMYKWTSTLGEETFVSYVRNKGVAIYKLTNINIELVKVWTIATISPSVTKIFNIAANQANDTIYVATNAGLFSIVVATDTITNLSPDKCLCVAVGNANSVFAVFNPAPGVGRISGSIGTNWQTALPIGSPSPSINWNNIWRLYIDRDSTSHNAMIIEGTVPLGVVVSTFSNASSSTRYIRRWWNSSAGVVGSNIFASAVSSSGHMWNDLILFPTHNSVLAQNGVWIYPSEVHPFYTIGSLISEVMGISKDLSEDLVASNFYYTSRNRGYLYNAITETVGNTANLNFNSFRMLCKAKIAVGFFNQTPLASIQTNAGGCGDWIKPKVASDGAVYTVVFSLAEHYVNPSDATRSPIYVDLSKIPGVTNPNTISSLNFATSASYSLPDRVSLFYSCTIDTTSTPVATIINYPDLDPTAVYAMDRTRAQNFGNVITTSDKRIIIADRQSDVIGAGFRMFSPIRKPAVDLTTQLCQTWSWNGTNWVDDPLNNGVGKPIHTATETLVDGLTINWTDLQPGNSKNLIVNQYYVVNRCTAPTQVPIDSHTPNTALEWEVSLRGRVENATTTFNNINSTNTMYIKEAPLGATPDPLFYSANISQTSNKYFATLNGVLVPVNLITGSPTAGSISLSSLGQVRTNSADNGKALVITYAYSLLLHPTETPT